MFRIGSVIAEVGEVEEEEEGGWGTWRWRGAGTELEQLKGEGGGGGADVWAVNVFSVGLSNGPQMERPLRAVGSSDRIGTENAQEHMTNKTFYS